MKQQNETKTILLVDDDDIFLTIMEVMLENVYKTIKTRSGKEALDYLCKGNTPHLILLDIVMPEMDGWETFNKLRGISLLKNVPIAFMTILDKTDAVKHANELGAADYIKKPCEREDLLNRIEAILSKNYAPDA